MKDGICPKCGSTEIYWRTEGDHSSKAVLGNDVYKLTYYGCMNCRYVESYLPEKVPVEMIRQFWMSLKRNKRKNDQ